MADASNRSGLNGLLAQDSYPINPASPDPALRDRSITSFAVELEPRHQPGSAGVVSHPGNYIDDREAGLARNAEGCSSTLERALSEVVVLLR